MTDETEPKNKLIVELFDIIAELSADRDVIKETATWAFEKNKGLSLVPEFIDSINTYGSDNDLRLVLTTLQDECVEDWHNKLPAEDITAVLKTLIDKYANCELDDELSNLIAAVLSIQPQEAVDLLNERMDSDDMIVMIKKMFFHLADC